MNTAVLELPSLNQTAIAAEHIEQEVAGANLFTDNFAESEIQSLKNNDAMAAGMIAVILGIAFTSLLCLAITASVWTLRSAG
jgi:hypothetical protein